jgi:hypothetical protein
MAGLHRMRVAGQRDALLLRLSPVATICAGEARTAAAQAFLDSNTLPVRVLRVVHQPLVVS